MIYLKILLLLCFSVYSYANTISDYANFNNERKNFLYGTGVVTGLSGTGDKSVGVKKLAFNILDPESLGLIESDFKTKNTAIVSLSGVLPSYSSIGDTLNLNIQTMGDAKSLKNGVLLLSFLKGQDGEVYAACQGTIKLKGENLTSGKIYNGCFVEKEITYSLNSIKNNILKLKQKNLLLAIKIKNTINNHFDINIAEVLDKKRIKIKKISSISNIELLATILSLELTNIKKIKQVVINYDKRIITSDRDIFIEPITLDTDDFSLAILSNTTKQNITPGDQNVGDDVILNVNKGLLKKQNKNVSVRDILRVLKILKIDFLEIVNIIKNLDEQKVIEANILEVH